MDGRLEVDFEHHCAYYMVVLNYVILNINREGRSTNVYSEEVATSNDTHRPLTY